MKKATQKVPKTDGIPIHWSAVAIYNMLGIIIDRTRPPVKEGRKN